MIDHTIKKWKYTKGSYLPPVAVSVFNVFTREEKFFKNRNEAGIWIYNHASIRKNILTTESVIHQLRNIINKKKVLYGEFVVKDVYVDKIPLEEQP